MTKQRRAARELVARYLESCAADLLAHVGTARDSYRDSNLSVAEDNAAKPSLR